MSAIQPYLEGMEGGEIGVCQNDANKISLTKTKANFLLLNFVISPTTTTTRLYPARPPAVTLSSLKM